MRFIIIYLIFIVERYSFVLTYIWQIKAIFL